LSNGVVGPWQGWTVVQSNNLPWSGTLELATNPSDGDTVTIAGVTFEWQDDLADVTTGNVGVLRHASAVDTSRANLVACINDSGTAGTNYVQMGAKANFIIRRKRRITATNDNSNDEMTLAGFGDIAVSDSLTDTTDCWNDEEQTGVFMIRGSIDMVLQFMDLKVADKEKGFADLPKGIIGVGTEVFDDGAVLMVKLTQDVSGW
jgi:carbohydrate-selective porin OprB